MTTVKAPLSRRRLLAGGLTGALAVLAHPSVRTYLDLLAPGSGRVWGDLGPPPAGTVDGPYGDAVVEHDGEGVPHIEADDERSLQFAHGYVQGHDRLFQLDLFRRQLRGQLSAVAGPVTTDSDEFYRRMDFAAAADASEAAITGTEVEPMLEAFVAGVNAARRTLTAPVETALLDYEIEPWTVADTLLIEKLMGWELTGSFRTLRRAALADHFGGSLATDLHPSRYDHEFSVLGSGSPTGSAGSTDGVTVPIEAVDWLSAFEPPPGVGSNSWVVAGAHTASGGPILANDPHLLLSSPPVWYEVALETPAFATRGVTFPGTPFVVIGRNRHAAWGFTNVPADVTDVYTYDVDGDSYRVGDDWFPFEADETSIEVAGEGDRTIARRWTHHGPYIDRHGATIAVQWTGLAGTRTVAAVRDLQFVDDHTTLLEAMERWDLPPQNLVYADDGGRTRYQLVGKVPIRQTAGDTVRGDQVFDGSAEEGSWTGFEPYGQPSWSGFIPLEALPQAVDRPVVATANQRIEADADHYYAEIHATPYRAMRLADRLDALIERGELTTDDMIAVQQDVHDEFAASVVPDILAAVERGDEPFDDAIAALEAWDGGMRVDAWAPVVFACWREAFRNLAFDRPLEAAGFDAAYGPSDWVLATLDGSHPWFDTAGDRDALITEAFEAAAERAAEYDDYGAFQRTRIDHPFEVGFLNYPRRPMPGSAHTLKNYRRDTPVGPGWQQVVDLGDGTAVGRLAGGNIGRVLSPHYADQLAAWIDGVYKPIEWSPDARRRLEIRGEPS